MSEPPATLPPALPPAALPGALEAAVTFDAQGLVCAVAQQHASGEVLMVAWINRAALAEPLASGRVCYRPEGPPSELQPQMRISFAASGLKKKNQNSYITCRRQ